MHSNTSTASILYNWKPPLSPSKMKRTESKTSKLNTAFICSTNGCNCVCCLLSLESWDNIVVDDNDNDENWVII